MMIDIKRAVSDDRKVRFVKLQDNALWYTTEFQEFFSVPFEDTKGAVFLAEDRAMLFMRWMRRWNDEIKMI